jgi:LDH2 family malate/lactate/ureidoglycolate dehydrogenase
VSENQLRRWQNCLFVPHSLIYYYPVAGYGWATTVELLSTAFQSGPFGEDLCGVDRATGAKKPMPFGHFFLAINIEALCPLETFKENSGKLLRALRARKKSPLGPGCIFTGGEPEHDERVKQYAQGGMNACTRSPSAEYEGLARQISITEGKVSLFTVRVNRRADVVCSALG